MKKYLVDKLVAWSKVTRSTTFIMGTMLASIVFFAALLPAGFIWLARFFEPLITVTWPPFVSPIIIVCATLLGIFFIGWATVSLSRMGHGAPAHAAPTQKLVVVGPYKLCRNPMQLGGILYYLGIGTFFGTPTTGIFCAFGVFFLGTLYHKIIEEKELEQRFGDQYREYKKNVPFLIPKFW